MRQYTSVIEVATTSPRTLLDITREVEAEVTASGIADGICSLYARGATAALMIQENDDPNLPLDVLDCLDGLVPAGQWRHDRIDDNGAAHIQAGLVGPSEVVPIRGGVLGLSRWQDVFLCDFDGPRRRRRIVVTIQGQ